MKKILFYIILLCSLAVNSAEAAEFVDGRIRLVIHEETGRFSLYYMADIGREEYLPFFFDEDPRTSFISLRVNNRSYRMGDSTFFRTRLGGTAQNPSIIFESTTLTLTQEFSFIRTGTSAQTNGVRISFTITNRSEQSIEGGLRFLIDTNLSEEELPHFTTDRQEISGETILDNTNLDRYWASENTRLGFMGSIGGENLTRPDYILFANWKRLNDVPWKPASIVPGRNFNLQPYSMNDSSVCYYFDPVTITQGSSRTITLALSSRDTAGFDQSSIQGSIVPSVNYERSGIDEELANSIKEDLLILQSMAVRLDSFLFSGIIPEDELAAMELLIYTIKSKYGIP